MRPVLFCMLFLLSPLLVQSQLQGRAKLDSMLSRLPYVAQDTSKCELLTAIAFEYGMISPDSGRMYAEQALAHAEELGWARGIFKAYQNIGVNYLSKGDFPTALEYHHKAREVEELNPGKIRPGSVLINIMLCHYYMDDHVAALDAGLEAMRIFEAHHDTAGLAKILGNLALVYASLGEYEKAIDQHRRSLDLYIFLGNKDGQGRALGNMGIAYQALKRYDEALEHDLAALALYEELGQRRGKAINLLNIGIIHRELDELDQALDRLEHALRLARELGDKAMIGVCLVSLGMVYHQSTEMNATALDGPLPGMSTTRRLQMARDLLQEGMELIEPTGHKQALKDGAFALSKVFERMGDTQKAFEYFRRGSTLRDSLDNAEIRTELARLEVRHEFEKQMLSDSLSFAAQQAIKDMEISEQQASIRKQRYALIISVLSLTLIIVLAMMIQKGKKRSDELLLNILPYETAQELKKKGRADARQIDEVTVLFTDFQGFTEIAGRTSPDELVEQINTCFSAFDRIMEKYGVEKIKTIGDAYMAAGGLPIPKSTHALDTVNAALEVTRFMQEQRTKMISEGRPYFEVRIGIHTGPVVAGIVGIKKFQYDIWGDTVNVANRMESNGEIGRVNISDNTYQLVKDHFSCTCRGDVEVKGKGMVRMYFVNGPLVSSSREEVDAAIMV